MYCYKQICVKYLEVIHTVLQLLNKNQSCFAIFVLARNSLHAFEIIMKSLDPLRAKKTFIRKKLGHTAVSAIKASSVTL